MFSFKTCEKEGIKIQQEQQNELAGISTSASDLVKTTLLPVTYDIKESQEIYAQLQTTYGPDLPDTGAVEETPVGPSLKK